MTRRPPMTDTELKSRKLVQPHLGQVSGTLGLAALGGSLLASKTGARYATKAFSVAGKAKPKALKPKKIRRALTPILTASAGTGAASAFNSASIGQEENRRKYGNTALRKSDPFNVSKLGEWKTIDQRERTQTRDRKVMRGAAAGVGIGSAAALGASELHGQKDEAHAARGAMKIGGNAKKTYKTGRALKQGRLSALGSAAKTAAHTAKGNKAGAILIGGTGLALGAAGVGGAAKGQHTYQQHKINQRRRAFHSKKVSKGYTLEMGAPNVEGISKRYFDDLEEIEKAKHKTRKEFDAEKKRLNRAQKYKQLGDVSAGVGAGVVGSYAGNRALDAKYGKLRPGTLSHVPKRVKVAAGIGAAGAAGAAAIRHKTKEGGSWR